MSYFTTGKSRFYEKMMTQKPHPMREDRKPVLPKDHLCFGCQRYGEGCVHPCHREVRRGASLEVTVCSL